MLKAEYHVYIGDYISVTCPGMCSLCGSHDTVLSSPFHWKLLITRCNTTLVTRRMPLVEQELHTCILATHVLTGSVLFNL